WSTYLFFFSSRRRHTRFSRDWSSDVCSSDLIIEKGKDALETPVDPKTIKPVMPKEEPAPPVEDGKAAPVLLPLGAQVTIFETDRSEERRVGKECRYWWSPYHEKKKRIEWYTQ